MNPIKETVLIYNLPLATEMKVKGLCAMMGVRIRIITPDSYEIPVGMLAFGTAEQMETYDKKTPDHPFTDPMLVFGGFTNPRLNQFLGRMRKSKIPKISLKAIVTEQNATWDSVKLHGELFQEDAFMKSQENK